MLDSEGERNMPPAEAGRLIVGVAGLLVEDSSPCSDISSWLLLCCRCIAELAFLMNAQCYFNKTDLESTIDLKRKDWILGEQKPRAVVPGKLTKLTITN